MDVKVSGLLVVRNEERRIARAIGSLRPFVDEIVVVDGTSTDATPSIAAALGARVLTRAPAGFSEADRRFAIEACQHDWVLMLDADELLQPHLGERLRRLAREDAADVAFLPRINWLLGAPLKGTGWGPEQDRQLRFFRKASVGLSDNIHEYIRPNAGARVERLAESDGALVHFNYAGVDDFLSRLNRYTTIEARQIVEGKRRLPRGTLREFVLRWIRLGGFRDGWRGWHLAWLMVSYRIAVAAKVEEFRRNGLDPDYDSIYEREAAAVLPQGR